MTLQINVAPVDLPHAAHILPHQLAPVGGTGAGDPVHVRPSPHAHTAGTSAEGWEERRAPMRELLEDLCRRSSRGSHRRGRLCARERDGRDRRRVHRRRRRFPPRTRRARPSTRTSTGSRGAKRPRVPPRLRSDVRRLQPDVDRRGRRAAGRASDVLGCSPLPGPPTADGQLRRRARCASSTARPRIASDAQHPPVPDRPPAPARRLAAPALPGRAMRSAAQGAAARQPSIQAAELAITDAMAAAGLFRVDFLGAPPGMWSLHPPYRSAEFYRELPRLLERIESGAIPDAQRGDYDINNSMFDWSSVARRERLRRIWA